MYFFASNNKIRIFKLLLRDYNKSYSKTFEKKMIMSCPSGGAIIMVQVLKLIDLNLLVLHKPRKSKVISLMVLSEEHGSAVFLLGT